MDKIFQMIIDSAKHGRPCALATLIKRTGSTPREAGARMLVFEDGSCRGSVGGGLLEARVREQARHVLETGRPFRLEFHLTGEEAAGTDMICGGEGEVFLEPVFPGDSQHIRIFAQILETVKQGSSGAAATALDPERWTGAAVPKAFVERAGGAAGSLFGDKEMPEDLVKRLRKALVSREVQVLTLEDDKGATMEVLVEPVAAHAVLYIFGGGHVSGEIAPLAARVGFKVAVLDDRPEFVSRDRFPQASELHCRPFHQAMAGLPVDPTSYLVIVTRGHTHDKTVLEQALSTEAAYIGMIGSRRKIEAIYKRLLEEGFSEEQLARVHAPIGIDIGAETPEEIAISIVAELIKVRSGGGKRTAEGVEAA
ncbi:MAG: XdhC family aldehyde oxidoreductase maturation factor [Desulfobacteraceae bacterium]